MSEYPLIPPSATILVGIMLSSKLYSKAGGAEAGANAEAGASTDGNNAEENVVHDADYKVEDDNKKE